MVFSCSGRLFRALAAATLNLTEGTLSELPRHLQVWPSGPNAGLLLCRVGQKKRHTFIFACNKWMHLPNFMILAHIKWKSIAVLFLNKLPGKASKNTDWLQMWPKKVEKWWTSQRWTKVKSLRLHRKISWRKTCRMKNKAIVAKYVNGTNLVVFSCFFRNPVISKQDKVMQMTAGSDISKTRVCELCALKQFQIPQVVNNHRAGTKSFYSRISDVNTLQ